MDLTQEIEYIAVCDRLKAAEAEADALKDRKTALEAAILERWIDAGLDSLKVDGTTLFVRETTYATMPQGKEAAVEALLAHDQYASLVKPTVNSNSLSALVRELRDQPGGIPAEWEGIIGSDSRFNVGIRRS